MSNRNPSHPEIGDGGRVLEHRTLVGAIAVGGEQDEGGVEGGRGRVHLQQADLAHEGLEFGLVVLEFRIMP